MRKIEIVILTAVTVLAVIAACLGATIHALFLSGISVLFCIAFAAWRIEGNLSKLVSLKEFQALSVVHQVISKVAADVALADSIAKSSKEAVEKMATKIENQETCKAPDSEQEQATKEEKK